MRRYYNCLAVYSPELLDLKNDSASWKDFTHLKVVEFSAFAR